MSVREDGIVKLIMIGDSGVGKTTAVLSFTGANLVADTKPTVGAGFYPASIDFENDETINMDIWDTAGQEVYRALVPQYARGANVGILVFSLVDRKTFAELDQWVKFIKDIDVSFPVILFGNKSDLDDQIVVTSDECQEYATKNNMEYMCGSALKGIGIQELFKFAAQQGKKAIRHIEKDPIKLDVAEQPKKKKSCC